MVYGPAIRRRMSVGRGQRRVASSSKGTRSFPGLRAAATLLPFPFALLIGERGFNRLSSPLREQMAIPLSHDFCLVAHPLVNYPLIDTRIREIRGERMTENVKSTQLSPLTSRKYPAKCLRCPLPAKGLIRLEAKC